MISSRRSRSTVVPALVGMLVVVGVSGCTADSPIEPSPAASAPSEWMSPVEPVWAIDVEVIGWPIVSSDLVLSYERAASGVHVVARDAGSGETRWSNPATLGWGSDAAISPTLRRMDGRTVVAYLEPDEGSGEYRLRVVDVQDGEPAGVQSRFTFTGSFPYGCADEAICISARLAETASLRTYRYDPERGLIPAVAGDDLPVAVSDGWELGWYMAASGETEVLEYRRDEAVRWTRPYTDVFGEDAAPRYGGRFQDSRNYTTIVGTSRAAPDLDFSRPGSYRGDLVSGSRAVGMDPANGETLWTAQGLTWCPAVTGAPTTEDITVMCRYESGQWALSWTGEEEGGIPIDLIDPRTEVVGVQRETGDVLWAVPIEDRSGSDVRLEHGYGAVVLREGEAVTVDIETGEVGEAPTHALVMCDVETSVSVPTPDGGERDAATLTRRLCSTAGEPAEGEVSRGAMAWAGFDGRRSAINLGDQLALFDLRGYKQGRR